MNQKPTKEELRDMLEKGMTLYQISRKYNTTIPVIFQLEKDYGMLHYTLSKVYCNISKEDLESMYIGEHMTQQQIADEIGGGIHNVGGMLDYYHIPARGRGRFNAQQRSSNADEIIRMYNDEHMTQEEIAKKFGYSRVHVCRILQERGVHTRVPNGTITHQEMSSITAEKIKYLIYKGMNQYQIAKHFNVSDVTICRLAEKFGIIEMVDGFRCTTPEHREWRQKVLKRDKYTCQMCGSQYNLEGHHIYPFHDYPERQFNVDNGVILCHECHKKIKGHEYDYAQQFLDITQPQCREHDIIESMPWEPPLELHSIIDYPEKEGLINHE